MRSFLKKWGGRIGLARGVALVVLMLLLLVRYDNPFLVEALRLRSFDLMQRIEPRVETNFPVVIVDIDERSLSRIGQWPWPRTVLAQLVDRLTAGGALVVGFDIMFAEPDRTSPAALPNSIEGIDDATRTLLESLPDNDEVFANSLSNCPCVLGYATLSEFVPSGNRVPTSPAAIAEVGGDPRAFLSLYPGVISNLPILENAAPGRGLFVTDPDQDGLVRRVPLLVRVGDAGQLTDSADKTESSEAKPLTILPALATEMLRVGSRQTTYTIKRSSVGITGLVIGKYPVPTDVEGQIWLRYAEGDSRRFVSAASVLDGTIPLERFTNKFVLIGTSAVGLRDLRATPVALDMPGVEIQAQILENVISNDVLNRPNYMFGAELAATAALALLLIIFVPAVRASWSFIVLILAVVAAGVVSWVFFHEKRILVDATFPAAAAGITYAVLVYLSHYRTEMQRRQTAEAFGRYLSPKMAERVSRDRNALKLGGDDRVMTVMFADARGFTSLSERYAREPQVLTGIVNKFLSAMSDEVQKLDGTVDKYMGDAVMAFWNAPEDQPGHQEIACRAALAMQAAIARLNEAWRTDPEFAVPDRTPPRIGVGVGINTGHCVVGNMGSEARLDYTVIGDPVNLASRIESQTKSYRVPIMITEATQRDAGMMAALEIDRIAVKGKEEAVTVYALLGDETVAASDAFKSLQSMQAEFLAAYRGRRWDEAEAQAEALARSYPSLADLYALFRTRIAELRANPPGTGPGEDWDGVYVAVDK